MRKTTSTIDLKLVNRNKVYRYIYEECKASKQSISRSLNLSLPTVNQNLSELFDMGLLTYTGTFDSSGGRKAKAISVNPKARFAVGVDITEREITIMSVNAKAETEKVMHVSRNFEANDEYAIFLANKIESYIDTYNIPRDKILGVGIAVPGTLSENKDCITNAPTLRITNQPIAFLTKYINYAVYVENDANAGGLAELYSRKHIENLSYLSVSQGVGGAIIIKDTLYTGSNNRSAEFGHIIIQKNGNKCNCGKNGCFEAYISTSLLTDQAGCDVEEFFRKLSDNDNYCIKVWDEYFDYLCNSISNIHTIFDCDVILGGILAAHIKPYISDIKKRLLELENFNNNAAYFQLCNHPDNGNCIGVALHFINEFINQI